jgi:2-polyprenyl-3-methyl-5-hydroxy-6-metoxy-1,4-benzoquinol methylase
MTETGSCLVCGSTGTEVLFTAKDHLVSGKDFVLKKCISCGFTFTADPPDEKDIARFYLSEDYISHSDKKQNLTDRVYHLARNYMLRKKYKLVSKMSGREKDAMVDIGSRRKEDTLADIESGREKSTMVDIGRSSGKSTLADIENSKGTGTLVDIGSGSGYFADYMNRKGWNVTGIELSEPAREYSISKFGLTVVFPTEISAIKDESADCVTLWHVMEHLYEPVMWLREINRILKDDGKCIIALPNIQSADAGWFGNGWAALDVPRHLWHFSLATLQAFIKGHGFICSKVIPMPLDIYYIATLSYKNRGCRLPLLRGTITGLFLNVRSLFKKERASSLIYVISKQHG